MAADEPESETGKRMRLVKGCGCTVALLGLALGILVIGNFDSGAWASALGAVVIGYLVYNMSGVNGFWER
ncbi:MAG TPA: hypothetical protein VJV78_01920 [Polyangiales bacterium]|nr:hypothetical protein [Polyangiales bacterium]